MSDDECSCGKRRYPSRRAARISARHYPAGGPMNIYRCPALPQLWHLGHIPDAVRNGTISKDEWLARKGRKR